MNWWKDERVITGDDIDTFYFSQFYLPGSSSDSLVPLVLCLSWCLMLILPSPLSDPPPPCPPAWGVNNNLRRQALHMLLVVAAAERQLCWKVLTSHCLILIFKKEKRKRDLTRGGIFLPPRHQHRHKNIHVRLKIASLRTRHSGDEDVRMALLCVFLHHSSTSNTCSGHSPVRWST